MNGVGLPGDRNVLLYIGTYTEALPYLQGKGPGIVTARFCLSSATFVIHAELTGSRNPTYLALGPSRRNLYAVNETDQFDDSPGGGVTAFEVDRLTGSPRQLNSQLSGGAMPCHIAVLGSGRYVAVANYGGGSVSVLSVRIDGGLSSDLAVNRHQGSGPNARQRGPHPHMVVPDPIGTSVYVTDLGADTLVNYKVRKNSGKLEVARALRLRPGSGPRHAAIHPSGSFAFVVNELDSTVTCVRLRGDSLRPEQVVSTVPDNFTAPNAPGAIVVSRSGRHVYISNRGHESVAVFEFDEAEGRLHLGDHFHAGGKTPRDLALTPNGDVLFVVNQGTNNIVAMQIDGQHGILTPLATMDVSTPACVVVANSPPS